MSDKIRPVSFKLGAGILFLPLIFSWFTLREGHSKKARAIAFGWLVVSLLVWMIGESEKMPEKSGATVNKESIAVVGRKSPESKTAGANGNENAGIVRDYKIVKKKDISMRAIQKPLSSYGPGEVSKLPSNIRKQYDVIVDGDISPEDLKATMIEAVKAEAARDPDIDEIVAFFYDRKEDIGFGYTMGKIEWCPGGSWAGVTPEIARSNDRSTYRYVMDVKKRGSQQADRPTQLDFKIYDAYRKALFDNPNISEDKVARRIAREFKWPRWMWKRSICGFLPSSPDKLVLLVEGKQTFVPTVNHASSIIEDRGNGGIAVGQTT